MKRRGPLNKHFCEKKFQISPMRQKKMSISSFSHYKSKFLAKPGKDSYYTASSYCPISLTSVLGKCMERIIHARLYAFAEHHKILDSEQDGFRKFRGTTHSLLRFSQSVLSGFSKQKATLATFIDMKKHLIQSGETVYFSSCMIKV